MTASHPPLTLSAKLCNELVALATDNQRERLAAGMLPTEELVDLARTELFRPFERLAGQGVTRWNTGDELTALRRAVHSAQDCTSVELIESRLTLVTTNATEWDRLRAVEVAVAEATHHAWLHPKDMDLICWRHAVKCRRCGRTRDAASAKVSITWGGRTLTREYKL